MSDLAGYGNTISAQPNFDGLHIGDKPGLSGYLVCFVYLVYLVHLVYPVSLVQPNKQDKPDRPNRPNEQDRLADFSASCSTFRAVPSTVSLIATVWLQAFPYRSHHPNGYT